jgi:hypothetical protein
MLAANKTPSPAQGPYEPEQPSPDSTGRVESEQLQPPDGAIIRAPNPLWGLILPGLGILVVGGAILYYVFPLFQDIGRTRDKFDSLKSNQWHMAVPTQPVIPPQIQNQTPQVQNPSFQPADPSPSRNPTTRIHGKKLNRTP